MTALAWRPTDDQLLDWKRRMQASLSAINSRVAENTKEGSAMKIYAVEVATAVENLQEILKTAGVDRFGLVVDSAAPATSTPPWWGRRQGNRNDRSLRG